MRDDDDQDDLFAKARYSDPETSHAAAESLSSTEIARLERFVYTTIRSQPNGATWDELYYITGIAKASISPRFKPLRNKGLIEFRCIADTEEKIKRPGDSGRGQIVWFAVQR